jgi:peptidoglycan/xylan/chitin deacetylase (PgdA/CDA1 family)
MKLRAPLSLLATLVVAGAILLGLRNGGQRPAPAPAAATAALAEVASHPERPAEAAPIIAALRANLTLQRKLILLFADEARLQGPARTAALADGHQLHHANRALMYQVDNALASLAREPGERRDPALAAVLGWIEGDPELLELDRLAFRDPLRIIQQGLPRAGSAEDAALLARVAKALAKVNRVEARVDAEYRQVFGGPGQERKGQPGDRKAWSAYVEELRRRLPVAAPAPQAAAARPEAGDREIDGHELPERVLVLSFDDGPHRVYTEEIKAILLRYRAPAVFFEVGRNLGAVDAAGAVALKPLAALTGELVQAGFRIGNHSYSHAQLSRESGQPLETEIAETDQLLRAIPGAHSRLFRFPYGARTAVQLQAIRAHQLRSVLWNIDSLDWADPVPSSVADRVLRAIASEKRGIILFHDIHDRAGKILPMLLERLRGEGYRFAGLDERGEVVLGDQP